MSRLPSSREETTYTIFNRNTILVFPNSISLIGNSWYDGADGISVKNTIDSIRRIIQV